MRTDFSELQQNLAGMEKECKNSLGYLKLSSRLVQESATNGPHWRHLFLEEKIEWHGHWLIGQDIFKGDEW